MQNTIVQSIELQGKRSGTGKSRQNSRGTGIAKLAGAAPLMEAAGATPIAREFILVDKPSSEGFLCPGHLKLYYMIVQG